MWQHTPEMLALLRDSARAFEAWRAKPTAQKMASLREDTAPRERVAQLVKDSIAKVAFLASELSPVEILDKRIFALIQRAYQIRGQRLAEARQFRLEHGGKMLDWASARSRVPSTVTDIVYGGGPQHGPWVMNRGNDLVYFGTKSVKDLAKAVPPRHLSLFNEAGWALTTLSRIQRAAAQGRTYEYPGMDLGITPADLQAMVREAQAKIPNFLELFKDIEAFSEGLLQITVLSGEKSLAEARRMSEAHEFYWPIPPSIDPASGVVPGRAGASRTAQMAHAGWLGSRGSLSPRMNIWLALERQTHNVITAYYENGLRNSVVETLEALEQKPNIDRTAKNALLRTMTRLNIDTEMVAKLTDGEMRKIIADHINAQAQALAQQQGVPANSVPQVTPDDVNLLIDPAKIYRSVDPRAINVIGVYRPDGRRQFWQVDDPLLYMALSSRHREVESAVSDLSRAFAGMTQPLKDVITSTAGFILNNMVRDPTNALLSSRDWEGVVFGWYQVVGLVNRIFNMRPEARVSSELLSLGAAAMREDADGLTRSEFRRELEKGILPPMDRRGRMTPKDWAVHLPGAVVATLAKPANMVHWALQLKRLSAFGESLQREGIRVRALQKGRSFMEVMRLGEEISGEFSRHSGSHALAALMRPAGFMNPRVQILARLAMNAFDPDPARWLRFAAGVVSAGATAAAGALLAYKYLMDDEDRKRYAERPVRDRMRYAEIGGVRASFEGGPAGAAAAIAWNAVFEALNGQPVRRREEMIREGLRRLADSPFMPLDFLPMHVRLGEELRNGTSFFTGNPIVDPWRADLPPALQYRPETPLMYRKIGKALEASPLKIEYAVSHGLGSTADELVRLVDRAARGVSLAGNERSDLPIVGKLFAREPRAYLSESVQSVLAADAQYAAVKLRMRERQDAYSQAVARRIEAMESLMDMAALQDPQDMRAARDRQQRMEPIADRKSVV